MKKIKNIFKNKVTRNASWMIIGRIYQMSLSFVVSMLTARYLGPSNYGLVNYASSFTSFFSTFCVLGINSVIVKNFIDHPNEEGKTTGSAIGVRMISSICSVVLIIPRAPPLSICNRQFASARFIFLLHFSHFIFLRFIFLPVRRTPAQTGGMSTRGAPCPRPASRAADPRASSRYRRLPCRRPARGRRRSAERRSRRGLYTRSLRAWGYG